LVRENLRHRRRRLSSEEYGQESETISSYKWRKLGRVNQTTWLQVRLVRSHFN
jgi:hypothetical protein